MSWSSCLLLSFWNLRATLDSGNRRSDSDSAEVDDDTVAPESELDGFSCFLPAPVASVSSRSKSSTNSGAFFSPEFLYHCWWSISNLGMVRLSAFAWAWVEMLCISIISCFWTRYTRCSSLTCCLNVCSCFRMAILMCSFSIFFLSCQLTGMGSIIWFMRDDKVSTNCCCCKQWQWLTPLHLYAAIIDASVV